MAPRNAQRSLAELEDALGRLLLRSNRLRLLDAAFRAAPPGLDRGAYAVLSGVARLGPSSAAVLAQEIGLDRTGTSRYADRLAEAGLLSRRPDPRDGRANLLTLTPRGRTAIAAMRAALIDYLAELTDGLGQRELSALVSGLRMLADPPPLTG